METMQSPVFAESAAILQFATESPVNNNSITSGAACLDLQTFPKWLLESKLWFSKAAIFPITDS